MEWKAGSSGQRGSRSGVLTRPSLAGGEASESLHHLSFQQEKRKRTGEGGSLKTQMLPQKGSEEPEGGQGLMKRARSLAVEGERVPSHKLCPIGCDPTGHSTSVSLGSTCQVAESTRRELFFTHYSLFLSSFSPVPRGLSLEVAPPAHTFPSKQPEGFTNISYSPAKTPGCCP